MRHSIPRFAWVALFALLTLSACGGADSDNDNEAGASESEGDTDSDDDGGSSETTASGASFSWDMPEPSPESHIVYVSRDGDDSEARVYSSSAVELGANPMRPAGKVRAFASIAAACEQVRGGQPDWVLLRRGDSWKDVKPCARSGAGADSHFVIGAYGEGARPRLLAGPDESVINIVSSPVQHFTMTDLALYSYTSDPDHPEYIEDSYGGAGIRACCGALFSDIVLQNLRIAYFDEALLIQRTSDSPTGSFEDITLRGSTIVGSYALGVDGGGHSSGAFLAGLKRLTLEGNTFDHNGWLVQNDGNAGNGTGGRATIFNHNLYISSGEDIEIRNNLFTRASSMAIKFRSDEPGKLKDVTIQDNLFADGEIGLSIGGNSDREHRFVDFTVKDNVFFRIGRSQPTGRTLSWGISVQDWDGGTIAGNIFARQDNEALSNTYAIRVAPGSTRNTVIRDNIAYELHGSGKGLIQLGDVAGPVTFADNRVASPSYESLLASAPRNGGEVELSGNLYSGMRARDRWFRIGDREVGPEAWRVEVGADSVETEMPAWADPGRTIASYIDAVNETTGSGFDNLFPEVLEQQRGNWDRRFEARAINEYLRNGFVVTSSADTTALSTAAVAKPPETQTGGGKASASRR